MPKIITVIVIIIILGILVSGYEYLQNTTQFSNTLDGIRHLFNNDLNGVLVGGVIGMFGVVIGYFANVYLEQYKSNIQNRKEHYDNIKQNCLEPLYKCVHSVYSNEFDFGWDTQNLAALAIKIGQYYNALSSRNSINTIIYDKCHFSFRRKTEGLDKILYEDLDKHFDYLVELLKNCEEFVCKNGSDAEQIMFNLSKFLYENKKYKKFIQKVIDDNSKVPKESIRLNYFIFVMLYLLTSNEEGAKNQVPAVLDHGRVDECLSIIKPYLGFNFRRKREWYHTEPDPEGNEKVERLWKIYKESEDLFDKTLREIDILKHKKSTLKGNCEYLE